VIVLGVWQLVTSAMNPKVIINGNYSPLCYHFPPQAVALISIASCCCYCCCCCCCVCPAHVPRTGVYQVVFGLLAIVAELRLETVLTHFKFLTHFLGLGAFYVFIGGLALGGSWYDIAVAIILLSVGLLYFAMGLCCRRFGEESFSGSGKGTGDRAKINTADASDREPVLGGQQRGSSSSVSGNTAGYYQPPLNRDVAAQNDIIGAANRGAWDTGAGGGGAGAGSAAANSKGAYSTGAGSDWSTAHSEGDVSIPRAVANAAIANPRQTVAVATAVANNPVARSAAAGAWEAARAGGDQDQMKRAAMERAVKDNNPFADS
jgi:hypothetical protein